MDTATNRKTVAWLRHVSLGALVGFASVLGLAALDAAPILKGLNPARMGFAQRATNVPPAVMHDFAVSTLSEVARVHFLVALFVAVALAIVHGVWWWAGCRSLRRFLAFDVCFFVWLYVSGQLRLMAVHPYARGAALWDYVFPFARNFFAPWLALLLVVVLAALLVHAFGRALPLGRRLAVLFSLVIFSPLLGPTSAGQADAVPEARAVATELPSPPVVIIGLDSLRPDHVSALGGPAGLTPNLDSFLDDAFVFSEARTPIARTHPSWVSMLTAASPDIHGVRYNRTDPWFTARLPETFAARLRASGYNTRFLTDDNMFSNLGAEHGFSTVDQPPPAYRTYGLKPLMQAWLMTLLPARWLAAFVPELDANRALFNNYDADDFTTKVVRALDTEIAKQQPFLLAAHFCVIHFPGTQPGPGFRAFQPENPAVGYFKVSLASLARQEQTVSQGQKERLLGLYRAGVHNADAQLGQLVRALKASGLYDQSYILVWSDHGESFSDGAGRPVLPSHGMYLDNGDQDLRVVLALKTPTSRGLRGRSDAVVRTIDVAPTLLELMGQGGFAETREGVSLVPLMTGAQLPELPVYAETEIKWGRPQHPEELGYSFNISQTYEYLASYGDLVVRPQFHGEIVHGKHRMLRRGGFKVVFTPTRDGVWRLLDVSGAERGDLQAQYPVEFAALKAELQERIRKDEASLPDTTKLRRSALAPPWWPWKTPPPNASMPNPSDEAASEMPE